MYLPFFLITMLYLPEKRKGRPCFFRDSGTLGILTIRILSLIIIKKPFIYIVFVDESSNTPECQKALQRSLDDPEGFWGEVAQELEWTKQWDKVLDNSNPPFTKW